MTILLTLFSCKDKQQSTYTADNRPAQFVWADSSGSGSNNCVYFRNDFTLEKLPKALLINIFADSRYQLFINGSFLNFGPLRFYPNNPQYDTYNITPFLIKGNNTVAVKVLSNEINTFQLSQNTGGFIAWSSPTERTVNFSTPGNWKCLYMNGYDTLLQKLTFPTGPLESYDARQNKFEISWNNPNEIPQDWKKAVVLLNQNAWGTLSPRSIPYLTQVVITPLKNEGLWELDTNAQIYSFSVKTPDTTLQGYNQLDHLFAKTYIYSPKNQVVEADIVWDEFWLNGIAINPVKSKLEFPNTNIISLPLKKGWNSLLIKYNSMGAVWNFYLSLPKTAQLFLSPNQIINDKVAFLTADRLLTSENDILDKNNSLIINNLGVKWLPHLATENVGNPAWEIASSKFSKRIPIEPYRVSEIKIQKKTASAMVFDLGGRQLGRIFIDVDAPVGTVIDIGFSEDKSTLLKGPIQNMATRFIADGKTHYFSTFNAYGVRLLQVNVTGHDSDVVIHNIGVVSQVYPFEKTGSFECSNPLLNQIWELGWRTLKVCADDSYYDTHFRERGLYSGDILPEYAITLAISGDSKLMRRSIELFQDSYGNELQSKSKQDFDPQKFDEYSIISLLLFRWYIDQTVDYEFAQKYYPNYVSLMNNILSQRDKRGLIFTKKGFIKRVNIEKENSSLTSLNSFMVEGFNSLAHIADFLRKEADAYTFRNHANEVKKNILKFCWDENKGAFTDGFKNDKPLQSFFPISNALPVLFGISTPEQNIKIKRFLNSELDNIDIVEEQGKILPYDGFYILGALYKLNAEKTAENFIIKHWSQMIFMLNEPVWQNFGDESNVSQGTLGDGWSGSPTYYLTTKVLGVSLGFPNYTSPKEIIISPNVENISWAKGKIPNPWGTISIEWKITGNKLFMNCDVPRHISYTVKPEGKLAEKELWVNGKRMN